MKERVRLVNGNIAVRAQLGKGALVRVWAHSIAELVQYAIKHHLVSP